VRRVRWSSLAFGSLRATTRWSSLAFGSLRATCCALLACLALLGVAGCDRNLEPFDPDEKPREPDLSKIFPEGAESAEPPQPSLPPAPGEARGAPPVASEEPGLQSSDAPVTGTVELAPELAGKTPAGAVLFIIARRGGGPPLAVKRVPNPQFPLPFTIGPDDRMIQTMPFAGPIALSARIDSDGNATSRSPGDLMGAARGGPVAPGAIGVVIVLDTLL
jgi:cytochrome c-type biogenesis protein CcmH